VGVGTHKSRDVKFHCYGSLVNRGGGGGGSGPPSLAMYVYSGVALPDPEFCCSRNSEEIYASGQKFPIDKERGMVNEISCCCLGHLLL
jgi:hypothetical protein